jgi:hypothetical protein
MCSIILGIFVCKYIPYLVQFYRDYYNNNDYSTNSVIIESVDIKPLIIESTNIEPVFNNKVSNNIFSLNHLLASELVKGLADFNKTLKSELVVQNNTYCSVLSNIADKYNYYKSDNNIGIYQSIINEINLDFSQKKHVSL